MWVLFLQETDSLVLACFRVSPLPIQLQTTVSPVPITMHLILLSLILLWTISTLGYSTICQHSHKKSSINSNHKGKMSRLNNKKNQSSVLYKLSHWIVDKISEFLFWASKEQRKRENKTKLITKGMVWDTHVSRINSITTPFACALHDTTFHLYPKWIMCVCTIFLY